MRRRPCLSREMLNEHLARADIVRKLRDVELAKLGVLILDNPHTGDRGEKAARVLLAGLRVNRNLDAARPTLTKRGVLRRNQHIRNDFVDSVLDIDNRL